MGLNCATQEHDERHHEAEGEDHPGYRMARVSNRLAAPVRLASSASTAARIHIFDETTESIRFRDFTEAGAESSVF